MRGNEKIKIILKLVLEQITDIYLYFLGFYVVCLILSYFFEQWKLFFNWPVFHISVVILGVLALLSTRGRQFIFSVFSRERKLKSLFLLFVFEIKKFILRMKSLNKIDCLKIVIVSVVLFYLSHKKINQIEFFILGYALFSILFVVKSRIAAAFALMFLISFPILLIMKKEPLAAKMAIYAYYFLIIVVATQVREYWREGKKVIHR